MWSVMFVNCQVSIFKMKFIYRHRPYFSQIGSQPMNSFESSNDNALSHDCPIADRMLLRSNRIRILNGEHQGELFLLEPLARFLDRQWNNLYLHSSSVQGLKMIVVKLQKFSQLSLICLSLGSATWLQCHLLSISSIWIRLCWGCLWLTSRFQLLLQRSWLTPSM